MLLLSLYFLFLSRYRGSWVLWQYRCEQSVLDYCHTHLSLHLNVGMEPSTQAQGGPGPALYQPSLMAALPSKPVLPCPQTHSHHHWAVHTTRLCLQTTVRQLHIITELLIRNERLCGRKLGLVKKQRRQLIYCRASWNQGNENENISQWK